MPRKVNHKSPEERVKGCKTLYDVLDKYAAHKVVKKLPTEQKVKNYGYISESN